MALSPGMTLGNFEIISPLGAGGMGEVYRARDTRLDREVALKILPEAVARDPDRTARFAREARTLAALNHLHIAQLHGLEEAGEVRALVMELVEGEDLSQVIARGPVPLDEALPIARQIADALEAAHDAGIIHRDLKPANIKVRPDGTVKVLDFGLAKALEPTIASAGDQSASPTITSPAQMTQAGMILGTAAYMSPEQARGRVLDRRTDVWAFGCVLFEMLTGSRAFGGDDVTETLASIMKSDPPMTRLPADTPVEIRRLLTRCLQKDRRLRLQHIGDARLELDDAAHPPAAPASPATPRVSGIRVWLGATVIALAALGAGIGLAQWSRPRTPEMPLQFAIVPPPQNTFATVSGGGTGVAPQLAVSPDGSSIVFVASTGKGPALWHRSLSSVEARILPGTESAAFPFWSPDSRAVGFFAEGKLKRIRVDGGPPLIVCDAVSGRGGTWNRDNVIIFSPSPGSPLHRVPAGGGGSEIISELDADYGESSHRFPQFLPDGRHFFYTASIGTCCPAAKPARIKIGDLDSKTTETLMNAESPIAFANGHVLFVDRYVLMAQPFDPASRKLAGEPFAVVDGLASEGSRYASFSASANGVLAHARGDARTDSRLTWFDRSGRPTAGADRQMILSLSLASDDTRAAAAMVDRQNGNRDIWVIDTVANTRTRVSFDARDDDAPIWLPDRQHLLYVGRRARNWSIIKTAIGAAANEQVLFSQADTLGVLFATDVSADGTQILLYRSATAGSAQSDVLVLRSGEAAPRPYLQTPADERDAVFSPDGKWVAYQGSELGQRPQVYVQPYPATGGKVQISLDLGLKPLWRSDGKELFFLSDDAVMSVTIDTTKGFQSGPPQPVFSVNSLGHGPTAGRQYGVTRDGQRFLVNVRSEGPLPQTLTVNTNWLTAARK